jgi:hypothetical protein
MEQKCLRTVLSAAAAAMPSFEDRVSFVVLSALFHPCSPTGKKGPENAHFRRANLIVVNYVCQVLLILPK